MKKGTFAAVALLAVALWVAPATGQGSDEPAPQAVAEELAGIQRSLGELVDLLGTMRRNQDAELVLRRIELHERRLAPLASRLQSNKQDQIGTRSDMTDVVEWKKRTEDQMHELEREGPEDLLDNLRLQASQAENQLQRLTRRLEGLQERQIDLEDRLADGRDEVEILDDLLRELLD